jgi:hypothetical protein
MSNNRSRNVSSPPAECASETAQVARPDVRELIRIALQGLAAMFDPDKQLFCHRLVRTEQGYRREGVSSPQYTVMTLLGLCQLQRAGARVPFAIEALYEPLARDTSWIRGAGDLGLMIWLTATLAPDQLRDFLRDIVLETALERCADAREARTTELSWFLAGLAHLAFALPDTLPDLTDLVAETYHRLEENQNACGLFCHMSRNKSVAGFLRGRIGTFADQIYPIYAISKFAQAFHVQEPIKTAFDCATAICGTQGELGQWWNLYETRTGRVAKQYPVYSVHQHGMAPMGLFALGEATGQSFDEFIYKGLRWIYGSNELGKDMRNPSENVVWGCVGPKSRAKKYKDALMSVFRSSIGESRVVSAGPFEILFEGRPYELGWLLYAFANRL